MIKWEGRPFLHQWPVPKPDGRIFQIFEASRQNLQVFKLGEYGLHVSANLGSMWRLRREDCVVVIGDAALIAQHGGRVVLLVSVSGII